MPENQLVTEIYVPESGKGFKRWLAVFGLFFLAFLWTFPFKETITKKVETILLGQRACPISYSKMNFTWFAPGIEFDKPVISGACFQKPGNDLPLKTLAVSFAGPNFTPLGIRMKAVIEAEDSTINAYPAIGFSEGAIRVTDTVISGKLLSKLTAIFARDIFTQAATSLAFIDGAISIEALFKTAQGQVTEAKIKADSKKLTLKPVSLSNGFVIPMMNLGVFNFTSELDASGKLFIEKLSLGANESTIAANFKGSLQLNRYNILFSNADLTGEIRFSEEFHKALPIVKLLLQGKEPTDGFYKLEIKGPLGQTRPNFL